MYSTDHNINNPLKVDTIQLLREISSWENPLIEYCTQDFYDLLQTRDPNTMYVITDRKHKKVYLGDLIISNSLTNPKYTVGIDKDDPNKFIVYHIYPQDWGYSVQDICKFDDPIKALNYARIYTFSGSHNMISLYQLIINYLENNIDCNDLILGTFAIFGYGGTPDFVILVNTIDTYNMKERSLSIYNHNNTRDIPAPLREDIRDWRDNDRNHMFRFYSAIYDVIVKYNFFTGERFKDIDNLDLSEPIREINNIFLFTGPV